MDRANKVERAEVRVAWGRNNCSRENSLVFCFGKIYNIM